MKAWRLFLYLCTMKKTILFIVLAFLVSSCTLRRIVDTSSHTNTRDSVRIAYIERVDSVYIDRWHNVTTKGDTIIKTDSITLYKYLRIYDRDTIVVNKTDTIRTTQTQYVEVKKKTPFKNFCTFGFFGMLALIVIYFLWRNYAKK